MKLRILCFSILSVCLLHIAGYFPVFKWKQGQIHHKIETLIKKSLPNDHLNLISISKENQHELKWQRKDKEFWYKGKLYDIVRLEKKDGITHYYCIDDTAETHLAYQFIENIKKQTNGTTGETTSLIDFFKKILNVYYPPQYSPDIPIVVVQFHKKNRVCVPYLNLYASTFYNVIDPPPKRLV